MVILSTNISSYFTLRNIHITYLLLTLITILLLIIMEIPSKAVTFICWCNAILVLILILNHGWSYFVKNMYEFIRRNPLDCVNSMNLSVNWDKKVTSGLVALKGQYFFSIQVLMICCLSYIFLYRYIGANSKEIRLENCGLKKVCLNTFVFIHSDHQ